MKIVAKALSIFIGILLAANIIAISVTPCFSLEPHNANAVWVEPASVGFGPANATVGTKFNVTVAMNITENVFTYGIGMKYDRTTLKASKAGFTKPPTSEYMTGHATTASGPIIDTSYLGNGTILVSESCSGMDFVPGPRNGTLIWVEFEFVKVPTPGQTLPFNISRYVNQGDTTVADDYLNTLTFTAHDATYTFEGPITPPPLSVTILPLSASIYVGQSVPFTSIVSGGAFPYTYQWYLDGNPVSGATSNNWTFAPIINGSYTIYLNVTDNIGATATSSNAFVTVAPPPGATRISVEPLEIRDLTMGPSSTFYVNITLANVTDLKVCEFNFTYDHSILSWIGIEVFKVQGQYPIANVILDDNAGFVWVNLNYPTAINVNAPTSIVMLHFHVEAYGETVLDLHDTHLLDSEAHAISHQELDGLFANRIRDVAVTNVVPALPYTYQGWPLPINVTVKNAGNASETFGVSVYYNDTNLIGIIPFVNLVPNAEATLTFAWNTSGVAEGNYTIKGVASTVPYEFNLTNNVYVDGIVQVLTIIHDIATTNVTTSRSWVYKGYIVQINVTAENLGNVTESFNVTAFADSNLIGLTHVTDLAPNAEVTLTFNWNTSLIAPCHNYTITANVTILPFEFNLTNNVYTDGFVEVRIVGDVDGDGRVSGLDVALAAWSFGAYGPDFLYPGSPPHPRWNPYADINDNNRIDGVDIAIITRNFGKSCSP